jgi:alkylhydroperoxidase family enzyme
VGYESTALPKRFKVAIRATDQLINDPNGTNDGLRLELIEQFSPGQAVELLVTAAFASAFSKAAIIWGPPEAIATTVVPSPTPDPTERDRTA